MNHQKMGNSLALLMICGFYSTNRAGEIAFENFSGGYGDLKLSAYPTLNTHDNPISAQITFRKYGVDFPVVDFNSSRIRIKNGELVSARVTGADWVIEFNSTVDPGRVKLTFSRDWERIFMEMKVCPVICSGIWNL